MLTSKEVLEKTGISRATLNNYISWGIVPRPEVLPPGPHDGAAPRIGYFQPGIVERIEEIQRLKRQGWSIGRITEHFGAAGASAAPPVAIPDRPVRPAVTAATGAAPHRPQPRSAGLPALSVGDIAQPAYLVNDRFELVWFNAAAGSPAWPNVAVLPPDAVSRGLFQYLLASRGQMPGAELPNPILRLHMGLARQRGASLEDVCRGVAAENVALLGSLYREAEPFEFPMVVRAPVAPQRADADGAFLYALSFQEGVLFVCLPGAGSVEVLPAPALAATGRAGRSQAGAPAVVPVAVAVLQLQHSTRLWCELPAEEYFELVGQVWATLEPIFERHGGLPGKHPGDGMVWYFMARAGGDPPWDALVAAQQAREAMRRLSRQWQARKGWTTELCMNTGIDEGQEWHGTLRPGGPQEFAMLGEAVARASLLSGVGRCGAVWASRNLVGKLAAPQRARLKYGVARKGRHAQEIFVPATYSRLEDLLEPMPETSRAADAFARLSVTEILDIAAEAGESRTHPHPK